MMSGRNGNDDSYIIRVHISMKTLAPQLWMFESSLYLSKLVNDIDLVVIKVNFTYILILFKFYFKQ